MRLDLRVVDLGAADAAPRARDRPRQTLCRRRRIRGAPRARDCRACCRAADARPARVRPRTCNRREARRTSNSIRSRARSAVSASMRRHCRDRLAAVAHPLARQRILVHGNRQDTVGVRAIVAGHDGYHAVERARLRDVEPDDLAVAYRAAQNAADQRVGMIEVRSVACAAGDLVDAVDQRHARARDSAVDDWIGGHEAASAAACTDSMIFT